jgi:hypothetical protein
MFHTECIALSNTNLNILGILLSVGNDVVCKNSDISEATWNVYKKI